MGIGISFLLNLSLLITVAYLANILYKYGLRKMPQRSLYVLSVLMMIFSGWICIKFGFRLNDDVRFDLRAVPLIIAAFVYSQPLTLIVIGVGIGLARLTFGLSDAAMAGLLNLTILGFVCAGLNLWMRRTSYRFAIKGIVTILVVNVINSLNLAVIGVVPPKHYLLDIMPIALPLSILLSLGFALILRDFQLGARQNLELKYANELLRKQADELQKAKIGLEDRAEQLAEASSHKSEFLATMSHELRTPLNSIINLAEMIAESDEASEEITEYGRIIHKSGEELLQIINDILDLSKVEAGRLEITNEEVVLAEIPVWMQLQFEQIAAQKKIAFTTRLEESLPDSIISDPQRIAQILRNLLSNAFKFTHEGHVELDIRRAPAKGTAEGEWLVFTVSDTGIGVAEDKQRAVFEAFQQADGSISRRYGGTGLGLSISSNLARLLGGYLRMESTEGQGSTFSFYLPLKPARSHCGEVHSQSELP
ncbi:ATP-binding protein [Paenibacillus sp. p3-SID1389]|uniref:ATP-binding protein n=1 Tax=Paenibacillus sp. p3-SID1389 TaxID=2916364 RepID=UPI0021A58B3B|nr:ATP-binding protein [Paenibacillus sp. p3-SID1389]MCT2197126.1 ATP-binding protein [Paenibacillus sp. p3-SID1389]